MIPCLSPNGQTAFKLDGAPDRLLIGTSAGVVHLRRDGPEGAWSNDGSSLDGKHIGALINAPGGHLFAGCHMKRGLFRSVDDGATWQSVGGQVVATDIFSLALLDGPGGTSILAGVEPVSLYRSDDLGDSWHELPSISVQPGGEHWTFPPPPHLPHLKSIEIDPSAPETFYACVEQGALLRTTDGGQSWTELDGMWRADDAAYRDAHRLAVAPWDPKTLFFASGTGVYKSTDAGDTWSLCEGIADRNAYPDVLVLSPRDGAIFVGGPVDVPGNWPGGNATGSLSRSLDGGASWTILDVPNGRGANFEALTIVDHPDGYSLFAADTMGRVFESKNRGDSWQEIASADPISKGAHYRLAAMSENLPRILGKTVTFLFYVVTSVTLKRAAARRRRAFAARRGAALLTAHDAASSAT